MKYLIYLLLFLLIIIESSITTMPWVLMFLIFFAVFVRSEVVFVMAFMSGVFIDILTLRPIGITSIFFLVILFLILLYERKFEIGTVYFVTIATFISSLLYFIVFPSSNIFSQIAICVILSFAFYILVKRVTAPRVKAY